MTPMVGEKRALELEVAVDGCVDIPLRTPLPAPGKVEGAEEAAAGPEAQPMVGERLDLEVAVDGYFDIPLRHAITKKIKLEPGGAGPAQPDSEARRVPEPAPKKPRAQRANSAPGRRTSKSGDIGGSGSGATDAGVTLELEDVGDGSLDTALQTTLPTLVKVEDAEAAAANRVAQPMVGERLDLEDAGNGWFDTALQTPRNTFKLEPGLAPGPAEPEAGPVPGPAEPEAGPVPAPAPKKPRAKPAKCAHGAQAEERLQGVRWGQHLCAQQGEEQVQGVRWGQHLCARQAEEPLQGVRWPPPPKYRAQCGLSLSERSLRPA